MRNRWAVSMVFAGWMTLPATAADLLRQILGASRAEHERLRVLQVLSELRDALGEAGLNAALARGRGTAADQALDLVQEALSVK